MINDTSPSPSTLQSNELLINIMLFNFMIFQGMNSAIDIGSGPGQLVSYFKVKFLVTVRAKKAIGSRHACAYAHQWDNCSGLLLTNI